MERRIMPTMVAPDIQPYKSVAIDKETGKRVVINSRKQHREFLYKNDYVEVGNDPISTPKREEIEESPTYSVDEMKKQGWVEENL